MNTYDYSGKVAAVTGGCNGIGAAVTERLANAGARGARWDMDVTDLIGTASSAEAKSRGDMVGVLAEFGIKFINAS